MGAIDLPQSAAHHQALDQLVESCFSVGAQCAVLEASKLLQALGHRDAAEKLLRHQQSILNRAASYERAEAVIRRARGEMSETKFSGPWPTMDEAKRAAERLPAMLREQAI